MQVSVSNKQTDLYTNLYEDTNSVHVSVCQTFSLLMKKDVCCCFLIENTNIYMF